MSVVTTERLTFSEAKARGELSTPYRAEVYCYKRVREASSNILGMALVREEVLIKE